MTRKDTPAPITHSGRPGATPVAITKKGAKRASQILSAALRVLAHEGQSALTLEGISSEVGIRKGNLQYYYPTRSDLLRAVLAEQVKRHKAEWLGAYDAAAADPVQRLRQMVRFELDINRDQTFLSQVREKWSLAGHDEGALALANDWNIWVTDRYAAAIGEIRPDLSKVSCRQTAVMVYSLLVGSAPFFDTHETLSSRRRGLDRRIEQTIMDMIDAAR